MDSVIMTTPGNGPKLRSRLRSAANAICARSSKNHIHHTYPKISHQNYNSHGRHKGIAFVFSNCNVGKSLQRSGSISTGNLKKTLLVTDANVKTTLSGKEKQSKDTSVKKCEDEEGTLVKELRSPPTRRTFSREAQEVWSGRVGPPHKRATADSLQALFNDLNLYPSKAQVFEMLVIARQSARRVDLTLAFGEFCFLAAQLRRHTIKKTLSSKSDSSDRLLVNNLPHADTTTTTSSTTTAAHNKTLLRSHSDIGSQQDAQQHPYEVFLGGSCNPTTWRSDVAIPTLDKMGITYFNPQVADWSLELIEIEHRAKQSARVLFFVLDADTRAAAAAVEAAHLAAASRPLVLVLQPYRRGQRIGGEIVSDQEYLDLSRGQAILQEVAERRNLPVFTELPAALRYTYQLLRGGRPYNPNAVTPSVASHLRKVRDAFDAADETKCGKLSPSQARNVLQSYTGVDLSLAHVENLIQMLMSQQTIEESSTSSSNSSSLNVNFELFCRLVAEVMEEVDFVNSETMWSPIYGCETNNLDEIEQKVRTLLRWEARLLLESLACDSSTKNTQQTSQSFNDNAATVQSTMARCERTHHMSWCAESATKWRHFFHSVHSAIAGFVSRIEFNATRSSDDVPSVLNSRRIHNSQHSGSTANPIRKCSTTYARRREQDNGSKQKQHRNASTESEVIAEGDTTKENVGRTGLSKGRKLSVIIPKVPVVEVGGSAGAALTPQTTQRLEGLAGSVRDEPLIRDVYLGGSCIVRTSWREDTVIPLLKKYNLTFYKPEMNDYNRIFSAPPYTPANGGKFTFDTPTNNNGLHRQNSNGNSVHRSSKVESLRNASKHERPSMTSYEGDQPEKKPKYSTNDLTPALDNRESDDVEVRQKDGPYPLQSGNRLSASDFYKIPENATPDPFRGMFDERQVHGSRVLLFGVTSDTRCLSPMVLASHCIGLRPRAVVLCVQLLKHTEGLSERAVKDYNRGRLYLKDLAMRENVPVYESMEEATQCVIRKLDNGDY